VTSVKKAHTSPGKDASKRRAFDYPMRPGSWPGGADPDRVVQLMARAPARPGADAAMAVGASRSRCGRIWFRQLADGEKELPGLAVGPFGSYMQPVLSRD
jgi:hypothetical protein